MTPDFGELDEVGLNLQAVLDPAGLPRSLRERLEQAAGPLGSDEQLIMIGNGGPRLWEALAAAGQRGEHPIDDFSVAAVGRWFTAHFPGRRYRLLYPGSAAIDLQAIGRIAGWHRPSPLMLGILPEWGTWYAYRVLIAADTALAPLCRPPGESPCSSCPDKPCIAGCPAGAMDGAAFSLRDCIAYRRAPESRCAASCVARLCCPVAVTQRYSDEQIRHSYANSLREIARFGAARD